MKLKKILITSAIAIILVILGTLFIPKKLALNYLEKAKNNTDALTQAQLLSKAVSLDKNLKDAYLLRAEAYLNIARADFYKIFSFVYLGKGITQEQLFYVDKAAKDLAKFPKHSKYEQQAYINILQKDFYKALNNISKSFESNPDSYELKKLQVLAYTGTKNYAQARDILENEILGLTDNKYLIYYTIARLYEIDMDFTSASEYYQKALSVDPENSDLMYKLTQKYIAFGNWDLARELIEKLYSSRLSSSAYVLAAAYYWRKDANKEETFNYLNKAVENKAPEIENINKFPYISWLLEDLRKDDAFKHFFKVKL